MLANIPPFSARYFAPNDRAVGSIVPVDKESDAFKERATYIDRALKLLNDDLKASGLEQDDESYAAAAELADFLKGGKGEVEDFLLNAASLVFEKHVYECGFNMSQYDEIYAIVDRALTESLGVSNALYNFTGTLKGFEFTAAVFALASFMIDTCNTELDARNRGGFVFSSPANLQ